MKRRVVAAAIGALFAGAISTTAFAMAASGDDDAKKADHSQAQKDHAKEHHGKSDKHHGHGKPDQAWKDAWKKLTPAQRAARMAELAQQHADGMKKFAACVKAAGDDTAARGKCERPLPPGLAKKRVR